MHQIIFYIISALLLISGVLTVTTLKFFRAAVFLLSTLVLTAGIYFMMAFNFIAIVQIVIYVGGIVVLILFSILLTSTPGAKVNKPKWKNLFSGLLIALAGFAITTFVFTGYAFRIISAGPENLQVKSIGTQLLNITGSGYLLPFEVITLLLLVAMISSITIAVGENRKPERIKIVPLDDTLDKILEEINAENNVDQNASEEIDGETALNK